MNIEDFKTFMGSRFSLDEKEVKLLEETDDYVRMEADITPPAFPVKMIEDLHWRKEEVEFAKSIENENVRLWAYYHRTSRASSFDERNFFFIITDQKGEQYRNFFNIYNKEGKVSLGNCTDWLFRRNEKQNETIEVIEEEIRILQALQDYYGPKFAEEKQRQETK